MLITFDQRGIIRFHKIRGLKALQTFDFAEEWHRIDYIFTNHIETTRIELKHELSDQISSQVSRPQPTLIESQRSSSSGVRPLGASNLEIRTIVYYAGHILAAYQA